MLRQLKLNAELKQKRAELEKLTSQQKDFLKRSEDLTASLDEAETEEDTELVTKSIEELETEINEAGCDEQVKTLNEEITRIEGELKDIDERSAKVEEPKAEEPKEEKREKEDGGIKRMHRNGKFFASMQRDAVNELITRDDVKEFLTRTRELVGQKRAVTGAELGIPEVMLDLLRDNLHRYSKLITKVRLKPVAGKARQNIAGTIPEGVWTEAIGTLNELAIAFNQVEVDGYKVGGYIPIPNSTLADSSDINLANEILDALGQAIGYAVDKAIAYGTGAKMPVGIATRLKETAQPSYWGTNESTWTDLHTSNIASIDPTSMTAEEFFSALVLKCAIAKPNYSDGQLFWVMNRATHMSILAKAVVFNAAGALVASVNNTMPIIGGEIIELEFMSDNDIIGGFGSLYLLAEREGSQLAVSEHVKFIEDQTVYKGTARYDGRPVKGEGFVAINIANGTFTSTKTFATDSANP